jgi:hypothetical protein
MQCGFAGSIQRKENEMLRLGKMAGGQQTRENNLKQYFSLVTLAAAALLICATQLRAQDRLTKAADNKTYAQALLNDVVSSNPDLIIVGFHAVAPGAQNQTMIASTLDRIGEKDDEEDLTVVAQQETILAVNLKDSTKFKVHMPMKDATGKVIGLLVLIFKNQTDKDQAYYCARALKIQDGVARRIPNLEALFRPAQ